MPLSAVAPGERPAKAAEVEPDLKRWLAARKFGKLPAGGTYAEGLANNMEVWQEQENERAIQMLLRWRVVLC